ncbi:MAG TPA: rhodanese-like domain-containing protein [Bacteroidetes bacterium]|nr:rhodanese-like domain-containing protein [Bacteroidota bacterium]
MPGLPSGIHCPDFRPGYIARTSVRDTLPGLPSGIHCPDFRPGYKLAKMKDQCKLSRWKILKSQLTNLSPEEFSKKLQASPGAVLIDCRKPDELSVGKLKGAINIDYLAYDFWERMEQMDKDKDYFVYCRSERRSIRTCTLMKNGGFKNVYNLDGGINAWVKKFGTADFVMA